MAVAEKSRDINAFSKLLTGYTESRTHGGEEHLETLLPSRESDSASAPDESPCLPS